jgi:aldehyde:ferredoxin oxidoreductase
MKTAEKRQLLMSHRKEQLSRLIQAYYRERGWTAAGIPTGNTLRQVGLWSFLNEKAKATISALAD